MKLRLRTTFIGILILAAVLPFCIALIAAETVGYRSLRRAQGRLFQTEAQNLAHAFILAVNEQLEDVDDWLALSDFSAQVAAVGAKQPALDDAALQQEIAGIEARWAGLPDTDPFLRGILENDLSTRLREFQRVKPLFAELLATDARGRLVAASQKSSDFWQADEKWWKEAAVLPRRALFLEGVHYDASAGVYSLDVSLPIRPRGESAAAPVGVVKGVINASPLLSLAAPPRTAARMIQQVVLEDGRILARLSGPKVEPLVESIPAAARARLKGRSGSMFVSLDGRTKHLIGYSAIGLKSSLPQGLKVTGMSPMFVVVYEEAAVAMAPVRKQVAMISVAGGIFVLLCALGGYFLAGRKILAPIEALRTAAQAIARSAKIGDADALTFPSLPALEPLRRIRTGDELEELAGEFAYMGGRVLTYHERLESEIAEKTAEIDRDLEMAREFQEALMPRNYPTVPSADQGDSVSLQFQHAYKPASSVGGDFFDVIKLSDHRAGIFIADVMGHGARSALVTAILRALLQNLASERAEPADFLAALNRHFYDIVRGSTETIFVSAFYIIIDTQSATASYASAGHPSPFFANETSGEIAPLLAGLKANPALGLFPGCKYSQWSRAIVPGDLFLLFTDGVHEAASPTGDEFGLDRLRDVIAAHLRKNVDQLTGAVVAAVHEFIHPDAPEDDICLVSVRIVGPVPKVSERPGTLVSAAAH